MFPVANKGRKQIDRVNKSRFVASVNGKNIPSQPRPEMNGDEKLFSKEFMGSPPTPPHYASSSIVHLLHHRSVDNIQSGPRAIVI